MTTIIVKKTKDKIIIGADSQVTSGFSNKRIISESVKLVDLGDIIVGSSGLVVVAKLLHLYINERKITKLRDERDVINFITDFEKWIRNTTNDTAFSVSYNSFIFIKGSKVWLVSDGYLIEVVKDFCAIGSGRERAYIGLELGHSVEEVLRAVCKYDLYSSEPIKIIEKDIKKKKKTS